MTNVLFVDGTAGFSPQRLSERPTGGIITSLTLIPQYLAKIGYSVVVASEYESTEKIEGVEYVRNIRDRDKEADVVVFNRNIYNHAFLDMFPRSRKIWWLHDIVDYRYMEDDSYLRMDKIVSLSNYCTEAYSDFFSVPRVRFTTIPNGVDKSVFFPSATHDKNLFVCASATVKGMYPLSFTLNNLLRVNPNAELRMYASQKLHDKEDGEREKEQLKKLGEQGAVICDPVPQKELARVLRSARAVLMPNHYPEICSNTMLQAQASGAPVVSSAIGSAPELIWHGDTGLLTHTKPHDMFWWWKDFAEQTAKIATDDKLYERIHAKSGAGILGWHEVGEKWHKLLAGGN